jgi:hypothetical protein
VRSATRPSTDGAPWGASGRVVVQPAAGDHDVVASKVGDGRTVAGAGTRAADGASSARGVELNGQKVGRCGDLAAQKRWQELVACATELDAAGIGDGARRFRDIGKAEAASEGADRRARQALGARNLKEAESQLKQMAPDSVYRKPLTDAFAEAEVGKLDEAKGIAEIYLKSRDCAGLKAYLAQNVSDTGTDRIVAVFTTALSTCGKSVQPAAASGKKPAGDVARPSPPAPAAAMPATGGKKPGDPSGAAPVVSRPAVPVSGGKPAVDEAGKEPALSAPGKLNCAGVDLDDIITQAKNLFTAGYAPSSLALMNKVLECRQSVQMYRLAAMYACRARDGGAAKRYFSKLPSEFQAETEQECQVEGIELRDP